MSTINKSRKSSANPEAAIDRPFDPAILRQARRIAEHYQVVLWREDGEWYGRGVELPLSMNDGKTAQACLANTRESFVTTIAVMLEQGKVPPPPASNNVRSEQMNIRLTAEEKLALEAVAKRRGFEGVSDFVRTTALAAANT